MVPTIPWGKFWQSLVVLGPGDLRLLDSFSPATAQEAPSCGNDPRFGAEASRRSASSRLRSPRTCITMGEKMKEYGAERLQNMFALRSFIDAGVRPTIGPDYVPGPFEPMMFLQPAVTRTMISAFGCMNGQLLSGARVYYAMARDGLFFRRAAALNRAHVPGTSLIMQGAWAGILVLIRVYDPATGRYGNLYSNLLDYVVSAALLFYILTISGVLRLRRLRPEAERPYRTWGHPLIPALYIVAAAVILAALFVYRPATTIPGLVIVIIGIPVYFGFHIRDSE